MSLSCKSISMPKKAEYVIQTLQEAGYEAYIVGGCVRDCLLGKTPMDWDITTSAVPQEVKALFPRTIDTGIEHGTVTVMMGKEGFEVTTYRIDGKYEDGRHPTQVTFTPSLSEDLRRRDFTINAMAYNPKDGLVDLFEGQQNLQDGVIRCVGNPMERFGEDALRMMRGVRFSAQLGYEIEKNTLNAMKCLAPSLSKISAERIQVELVKLLVSDHPEYLRKAYETGLTKVFLPEFDAIMEQPQKHKHHKYSVGEHTLAALPYTPADKTMRLAMLLHDIGKPATLSVDEDGTTHFYNHPNEGEKLARAILRRLKFDNDTTDMVCRFVKYHDFTIHSECTPATARKMIHKIGPEAFPALFDISYADLMAQSDYKKEEKQLHLKNWRSAYEEIVKKEQCVTLNQLAVNGKDLIELGMQPGRQLGSVLEKLLQMVLEEPELNKKETLLKAAEEMKENFS